MKQQPAKAAIPLTLAAIFTIAVAGPASAYIGPGAGLGLLGALWGLVVAVGVSLAFVLMWPLRRFLKRRKPAAVRHIAAQPGDGRTADDASPRRAD